MAPHELDEEDLEFFGEFDWYRRRHESGLVEAAESVPGGGGDQALSSLLELYPPDVCRTIVERGERILVFPLFAPGLSSMLRPTLLLGRDLAQVPTTKDRQRVLSPLRRLERFAETRFEVGVWAALLRAGLAVESEAELEAEVQRAGQSTPMRPDFRVVDSSVRVALDTKCLRRAQWEANRDGVESVLSDLDAALRPADGTAHPDLFLDLDEKADETVERSSVGPFRREILPTWAGSLEAAVTELRRCAVPHEVVVMGIGTLLTSVSERDRGWSVGVRGPEEHGPGGVATRVARAVVAGAAQVNAVDADVRAVVILLSIGHLRVDHPPPELRQAVTGRSRELAGLDAVVFLNSSLEANGWRTAVLVARLSGPKPGLMPGARWIDALKDYSWSY
jgi:hypothetical protein